MGPANFRAAYHPYEEHMLDQKRRYECTWAAKSGISILWETLNPELRYSQIVAAIYLPR